jgi:hypothetical protein
MKIFYCVVLLLINIQYINSQNINKVLISYVDYEIETPLAVSCENFTNDFYNEKKDIQVSQKRDIVKLVNIIKKLTIDTTQGFPDTRLIIKIYYENRISTLCMNDLRIAIDGTCYLFSQSLYDLIEHFKNKYSANKIHKQHQ